MLTAALSGRPTLVFEPNVVPGFANRIVAPMVSAAAVHFSETCRYFRSCRVTGVPIRRNFFQVASRPEHAPPTLLVFGGSQGARAINKAVIAALRPLCDRVPGLHIIHQTGERDYNEAQTDYLHAGVSAELYPFIDDMPGAFARADLLLCRSGASSVAEITAAGKPAIFVPFPQASDDHQRRNAEALAQAGAALMLPESELTPERLAEAVASVMFERRKLTRMAAAARSLSHPNAARDIADMAARLAGCVAREVSA
jgi:UDP-N-acetylglucosamine--N-acetylmuramyl-(pentapeptide) pyrophosphoryl-undecaprenol N-acetylglucosamine transferase